MNFRLPLAALTLLAPAASAGQVWVVQDASQLSSAIAAAQHGDIVLLKSGIYASASGFSISDKAVSLVADSGATVDLQGRLLLDSLPATSACVLQRLHVTNAMPNQQVLLANGVSSPLWIEDCTFEGLLLPGAQVTSPAAALLVNCSRAALHGTSFVGAPGKPVNNGGTGLELFQSNVGMNSCTARGGTGSAATSLFVPPAQGGNGVQVSDGFLYAAGTTFEGGTGGDGFAGVNPTPCFAGAPGGAGVRLLQFQFSPPVRLLGAQTIGGAGGAAAGSCAGGPSGLGIMLDGPPTNNVQVLAGSARELDVTSPVREGQSLAWTLSGEPGDLAFLAYSGAANYLYQAGLFGVLHLGAPFFVQYAGVVPAGGQVTGSVPLNDLGPGVDGALLFLQSGYFDGTSARLGAPAAALLLDQAL
jgi:hypothetical protein